MPAEPWQEKARKKPVTAMAGGRKNFHSNANQNKDAGYPDEESGVK
jgi:hypothetical protein